MRAVNERIDEVEKAIPQGYEHSVSRRYEPSRQSLPAGWFVGTRLIRR